MGIGGNPVAPVAETLLNTYEVSSDTVINALTTHSQNAPNVLLKLKLTKDAGALNHFIFFPHIVFNTELRTTAGISFVGIAIQSSADDITYSDEFSQSTTSGTFVVNDTDQNDLYMPDNTLYIRIGLYTGNGTTSGEMQFYKLFFELLLPQGYTVERLI